MNDPRTEPLIEIVQSHGFDVTPTTSPSNYDKSLYTALGIGDLLLAFTILSNKLIEPPLIIDANVFVGNRHYADPLNALNFRLQLISKLIKDNNIPKENVIITFQTKNYLEQHIEQISLIDNGMWNLAFKSIAADHDLIKSDYIVFHTKLRFVRGYNYADIRNRLAQLFANLKTNKKCIILGEQEMPDGHEVQHHGIGTIHKELQLLKTNNEVVDMSTPKILESLDFERYCSFVDIIRNAKHNVVIGYGGQLSTCLCLSANNTICYIDKPETIGIRFHDSIYNSIAYTNFDIFEERLQGICLES